MVENNKNDEPAQLLIKLGLSVLQTKVYLTLLLSNASTAKEISAISKVSRPDVYRVLAQLEENEFVEKTIANPTRYNVVPIEESIRRLLQKRISETEEIQNKIPQLIQNLKETSNKELVSLKSEFTLISKEAISREIEEKTRRAQESIFVISSANRIVFKIEPLQSAFAEALSKKVNMRLIIPEPENKKLRNMITKRINSTSNFQLMFANQLFDITVAIIDGKEVFICTQPLDSPDVSTLWSNNKCLIDLCQGYFFNYWSKQGKH